MMRAVGHDRVALLDGGWRAALAAGIPVDSPTLESTEASPPLETVDYPRPTGGTWVLPIADAEEVQVRRLSRDSVLVDVRSSVRYRGEEESLDPIAGHIPGAVNDPYASNLDAEGRFRSAEELRARLETTLKDAGSRNAIVYCGSGVTACHTLLAMDIAGLEGAALYVGSWSEWCRNGRPRASVYSD
jgi:thiosulfate/3-mercaptopyruvate sulfurtransferase